MESTEIGDMVGHADTRMVETVYVRVIHTDVMKLRGLLKKINQNYAS